MYLIGSVKKIGNDAFTFPLGSADDAGGYYHPLTISAPASATDAFTAKYVYGSHGISTNADSTIENYFAVIFNAMHDNILSTEQKMTIFVIIMLL